MQQERIFVLIGKQQSGEISPSEAVELRKLLEESDLTDGLLQSLDELWHTPMQEPSMDEAAIESRWDAFVAKRDSSLVKETGSKQGQLRKLWRTVAVAAAILLVMATGAWLYIAQRGKTLIAKQNIISTRNGSRSKVELPDGTQVWLNAGSKLVYHDDFGKELREVELSGEAFFDVTKDAEHPFIIHARAMNIRVVGTAFNVRSYPDEKTTEASLLRGIIEVTFPGRPADKLYLKPNEKISVVNDSLLLDSGNEAHKPALAGNTTVGTDNKPLISFSRLAYEPGKDSLMLETSWIKNKLIFRNRSFDDLLKDMERWYNVSFVVKDPALLQKHFTGTFYHESVTEALDILNISYPFHYNVDKLNNLIVLDR